MSTAEDRFARFLAQLDAIFQLEPEAFPFESPLPGLPAVTALAYRDVPEDGHITGVTYGLSEVAHPEWRLGRPELIISVESTDIAWPLAAAELARGLRGDCPFAYGNVINFGAPVAEGSQMDAFVVFAPAILDREAFLGIDVGGPQPLNLAGLYPIHAAEGQVIEEIGLEAFWHHEGFDPYSVTRPPIVLS